MVCRLFILTVALVSQMFLLSLAPASEVTITRYAHLQNKNTPFYWCTGIFFLNGFEYVTSIKNNRLLFRKTGDDSFSSAPMILNHPHAIAYNALEKLYYLVDTDNHRVITFTHPEDKSSYTYNNHITGIHVQRPHDVTVDPESGWVYVLIPNPSTVFRFKSIGVHEELLDLSMYLEYSRSLTLKEGKLYVIGSSSGKVVQIDDFSRARVTVYQSPGKKRNSFSGNWRETGLIPNDLEYLDGYWYMTSYFCPASCGTSPCDFDKNKFIRFSSWQDFEQGTWEDISDQLPSGLVPYFITVHNGALYVALYKHSFPGTDDAIYRL